MAKTASIRMIVLIISVAATTGVGAAPGSADSVLTGSNERLLPGSVIEITDGWQFRKVGDDTWYPATVPGCVHTDLVANHLIEDPFDETNERDLQWIEEEDWEYRVRFVLDEETLGREHIEIGFAGLDTYADVYLNDSLLFAADNMFRRWRCDCRNVLTNGDNVLLVRFHSPVSMVRDAWNSIGYELPGGPKVLTRKAGYQYGWDWGPRFVTSGIWRPAYLHMWDQVRIEDLHIMQKRVTDQVAVLSAVFTIEAVDQREVSLSILDQDVDKTLDGLDVTLDPGTNVVMLDFDIPDPILWWTNGLGEPHLYRCAGELRIDGKVVDRVAHRIGIRTLEVVRETDDIGESFYFRLNGVPLFMKGSNYVPQDNFLGRVTPQRYEALIRSAAYANMNMLRVWGGGVYEDDIFYDLCDEYGILVWQDFMFACAMYPGDEIFLDNVENEAVDNVKRLRNHPCIALWCGNNEIEEAWHNWGWQEAYGYTAQTAAEIWKDYRKLFYELLPRVVERYDGDRFYWPSSPKYGRGDPRSRFEGDSHYWGVWHDGQPFASFSEQTGRFMSEYGFQSFPSLRTVQTFARPEDWDIDSEVMLFHQKHPRGNELILTYMQRDYKVPTDFENFLYVSQVLQAEGIGFGIEAHRREKPYCMGSLYWQLNDCWPVASWSSIDCYGRWKALHYYAKRANSTVLVSPLETDGVLSVYVISDRLEDIRGTLRLALIDFAGSTLWERDVDVVVGANSSGQYYSEDVANLLGGNGTRGVVLVAELYNDRKLVSRNLHYFAPSKELDLPRPAVNVEIMPTDIGATVRVSSDSLLKNCYLYTEGMDGFFDDNFFDVLPGETKTVELYTDERTDDIARRIKVKSLVDTF